MMVASDTKEQLDRKLTDAALAYRLVREMANRLENSRDIGRAELVLLQIESVGNYLAQLGKEQNCHRGLLQWKSRTTYSLGN